jgi:hypothetical protein
MPGAPAARRYAMMLVGSTGPMRSGVVHAAGFKELDRALISFLRRRGELQGVRPCWR